MNFWKTLLAAILGVFISSLLLLIIGFFWVLALVSSASEKELVNVPEKAVLHLKLARPIAERAVDDPWAKLAGETQPVGLNDILAAIRYAKTDARIQGIYLETPYMVAGQATHESVRNALIDFKQSGKFIYSYGEILGEGGYYLASVADSVFLFPNGFMEWNGLASTPMFLKGMFDKLGIEPMLFKVGTFKSYGETYTNRQMSDANREQTQVLLNDLWQHMTGKIAEARKMEQAKLLQLASELSISTAKTALDAKLIDGLRYPDEVEAMIKTKLGIDQKRKLPTVSVGGYARVAEAAAQFKTNKIAIVYASGEIASGEGSNDRIGSAGTVAALRKARLDDNVKAIIFRIDSPGGSSLASDVIWREVMLCKKAKPIIASYGDVSASGGYYISAACDKIVAQPNTITGSIGIFGLLFNTEKLFNDKLGITFDRVTTNPYADVGNPNRQMNAAERAWMQANVENGYKTFVGVVQQGRGYADYATVDKIAQGRVWSGKRAKELKLVDELGGMDVALKIAAEKAGLGDDYSIVEYPRLKTSYEQLAEAFGQDARMTFGRLFMTEEERLYHKLRQELANAPADGLYMLLPESYDIK